LLGLTEATKALSKQIVDVAPAAGNHLVAIATFYDFYPASQQSRQVRRLRRHIRRPLRTGKGRLRPRDCESSVILRRIYNSRNSNGHLVPLITMSHPEWLLIKTAKICLLAGHQASDLEKRFVSHDRRRQTP
jgi:hypothetical protein